MLNNDWMDTCPKTNSFYPCYYKIILNSHDKVGICELQSFDECDYDQDRFYKNANGECLAFWSKQNAKVYVNKHFRPEFIDEEVKTNVTLFDGMLK